MNEVTSRIDVAGISRFFMRRCIPPRKVAVRPRRCQSPETLRESHRLTRHNIVPQEPAVVRFTRAVSLGCDQTADGCERAVLV